MANHLHWYIHGSIGARDGQEVDITKPLNLGEINSYSNLCTYPNRDYKYYPIIALPLFLRTETGFEISSGSLTVGYADTSVGFIGALCTNNNWTPELFNTKTALKAALDSSRFKISGNNIALTITTSNKIADTNSCLFLMCAYMNKDKASELYPINLINFSFTETEVTS